MFSTCYVNYNEPGIGNDLLRILAQRRQCRALHRIGLTGQAQHQGIQRAAQGGSTFFRLLTADRFADLVQITYRRGKRRQAGQRQTD